MKLDYNLFFMKKLIPGIVIILFSITSCYYDSQEYLYPELNTSCDTTNVTYTASVVPILENSCYSCHSNATASSFGGAIKLQNYDDVKLHVDDGKLLGSIKRTGGYSPMPKGSSQLVSCKITTVQKWIDAGAPNN